MSHSKPSQIVLTAARPPKGIYVLWDALLSALLLGGGLTALAGPWGDFMPAWYGPAAAAVLAWSLCRLAGVLREKETLAWCLRLDLLRLALVLILVFSVSLRWLPSSGAYAVGQENNLSDRIVHMILPLAVIVTEHLWYYGYMVRNKMLDEVRADYVLLAKAKGMKKSRIMITHCLRNIMPSYLSIMAISVAHIMGGTYVVETVFSYPGIGTLAYESARYKDYNLLMVVSLLSGIIVIVCNMAAQILNERIDPRIRISRQPDIQEVREHE